MRFSACATFLLGVIRPETGSSQLHVPTEAEPHQTVECRCPNGSTYKIAVSDADEFDGCPDPPSDNDCPQQAVFDAGEFIPFPALFDEDRNPIVLNSAMPPQPPPLPPPPPEEEPLQIALSGFGPVEDNPEDPVALPSLAATSTVGSPEEEVETTYFFASRPGDDAMMPTAQNKATCNKEKLGEEVDVAFDSTLSCAECRNFYGQASDGNTCGDGWELSYSLGADRALIRLTACADASTLIIEMTGPDQAPFTEAERDFFNKIADGIEGNTNRDISIKGSLDALAVDASRALAAWPPGEFPIDFVWPVKGKTINWFDPELLVRKDSCAFVPVIDGGSGSNPSPSSLSPTDHTAPEPTDQPAPQQSFPSKTINQSQGGSSPFAESPRSDPTSSEPCTEICNVRSDGTSVFLQGRCLSEPDLSDHLTNHACDFVIGNRPECECDEIGSMEDFLNCKPPSCPDNPRDRLDANGILQPVAPTQAPTSCFDICHVSSDGTQLLLAYDCLGPAELASQLEFYACDFEIDGRPKCGCDQINTIDQFRECTTNRPNCPDNPIQRLNNDGFLQPDVPTPAPTDCVKLCRMSGHFDEDGTRVLRATSICLHPDEVEGIFQEHSCDWINNGGTCDCENGFDEAMFDRCSDESVCPPFNAGLLAEDGILRAEPQCIPTCHIASTGSTLSLQPTCLEPAAATQDLVDHPCDYEIHPGCECSSRMSFSDIQTCAPRCPNNPVDMLNPEGTLHPVVPMKAPSTGCIRMCHVEYSPTTSNSETTVTANALPQCNPPGDVISQLAENDCDWIIERDECDCVLHTFDQTMLESCSPEACGAREENVPSAPTPARVTICHLTFEGNEVDVQERAFLSQANADADHADHNCDYAVTDNCPCIEDGEYDVEQIERCPPDTCPQKHQIRMKNLRYVVRK